MRKLVDGLEDVVEGPGDDAPQVLGVSLALHGEGLPRAGLALGEDSPVVALQH